MRRFHINNVKLKNKLLIVFFLAVIIPVILTNGIFYLVTTENVKEQKVEDLELSLEQVANSFQKSVEDAIEVSTVLYADSYLYGFLERRYEKEIDFIETYNSFFRDISKFTPIYSSVNSISLYTNNETVLFAGGIHRIDEDVKKTLWYSRMVEANSLYPVVTRTQGESGNFDTFSVIRELDTFSEDSTQKIIKIDLNPAVIEEAFQNLTFQGDIYLVNEDGIIQYTTAPTINWKRVMKKFDYSTIPESRMVLEESYPMYYLQDWKVIGVVSEDALVQEVTSSRKFIVYLTLLNIVVPSLIIIYITTNIHRRLSRVMRHIRNLGSQKFETMDGDDYLDEIGVLTSEFNRMTLKIKDLIDDVYIAGIQKKEIELQRKQAQLSALQSQINPHFLFNVLETIRMRSLMKDEKETSKIIHNMAVILRRSFIWGRDWVTVKEELNLIRSFLEIQHYRFDDKMLYEIDVEDSVQDCIIPHMAFIPFVENASIHGIEPLKNQGQITINIFQNNVRLVFEVIDNGMGMDKSTYDALMDSLQKEEIIGESIGIRNVYQRLKMHYQEDFSFEIISEKHKGTTVRLEIPLLKE